MTRQAQVKSLVRQYASIVERRWSQPPGISRGGKPRLFWNFHVIPKSNTKSKDRNTQISLTFRRISKLSKVWETRYQQRGTDHPWYISEPPEQLVRQLETGEIPEGPALDVGCGPGVASRYLAARFHPTIGLDFSITAIRMARQYATERGYGPCYIAANAVVLPFRERTFSFVFDRGCLQDLPRIWWKTYFEEVERVLRYDGVFQLLCLNSKNFPSISSLSGILARFRRYVIEQKCFITPTLISRLVPSSMEKVRLEDFSFQLKNGKTVFLTECVFSKSTE